MLHLQLPPSAGAIANTVKSEILATMDRERIGYLQACKAHKISSARAQAELKADKVFAEAVESLRVSLAEWYADEAVRLADKGATALQIDVRKWYSEKVSPRFKRPDAKGVEVNISDNRVVVVTEEKRKELQEKLAKWQLDNV